MDTELKSALDLLRRLPPQNVNKNLYDVISLQPDLCERLLQAVDTPLKVMRDAVAGRDYLLCDYNRDGDSYRSPWSNTYEPPLDNGVFPSNELRKLEIQMNSSFDIYRQMYFDGGISSVYLWDDDNGFNGVILIKKSADTETANGCWDSIHVVEVTVNEKTHVAHYKVTCTVMLWLTTRDDSNGLFNLGGSLTRMVTKDAPIAEGLFSHIANLGTIVEDLETRMRTLLNDVYFGTSKNVVDSMRSTVSLSSTNGQKKLMNELASRLGGGRHTEDS